MNQLLQTVDDAIDAVRSAQRDIRGLEDTIDELREEKRQMLELLVPRSIPVPAVWQLTTQEAKAFRHIASRETATRQSMMLALYSDRPDCDAAHGRFYDVLVHKIRRKLAPFGLQIFTRRLVGWSLGDRAAIVTKLVEQHGPLEAGMMENDAFEAAQVLGQYLSDMTQGNAPTARFQLLMRVLFAQCVQHEHGNLGAGAQLFLSVTQSYWEGLSGTHFDVTGERLDRPASA